MNKIAGLWIVLLVLTVCSPEARAQVFSGGDPAGYSLAPFTYLDAEAGDQPTWGGIWDNQFRACTGGPDFMMIVGLQYEGFWAVGPSGFDKEAYQYQIMSMPELAGLLGWDEDDEIVDMAASWDREWFYASFRPYYNFVQCMPILKISVHGEVEEAVSCADLAAIHDGPLRVNQLATAPDDMLYALVWFHESLKGYLVHIDPAKPEGERVEVLLSNKDLPNHMSGLDESKLQELTGPIAVDDQGRVFVLAQVMQLTLEDEYVPPAHVLLRLDPDGTVTELTEREGTQYTGYNVEKMYPAQACVAGLDYDPKERLLVAGGNDRVFLIDPDEPGVNHLLIDSTAMMNTILTFGGQGVEHNTGGAIHPGTCLGNMSLGDDPVWATFEGTFLMFSYDTNLLDVDHDFALGYEELAAGTDPHNPDSDGGGIHDGLEFVDYTDPLDPEDDRLFGQTPEHWTLPGQWFGSRAGTSVSSGPDVQRWGVSMPDGSLLLHKHDGGGGTYHRFTGWDEPLQATLFRPEEQVLTVAGPDGSIYKASHDQGLVRAESDGIDKVLFDKATARNLLLSDTVRITGLDVKSDGTVLAGYETGHLLALDEHGGVEIVYDAFADFEAAYLYSKEDGCFGGCKCDVPIGPITFDPVRSILYFWFTTNIACGGGGGFMTHLVAVLPNGLMRVVGDHWMFADSMVYYGGVSVMDMVPDMKGGLWIQGWAGIERALIHLDANYKVTPVANFEGPAKYQFGLSWSLAHNTDLMVTPDGRLFTVGARYYNMYPSAHGLIEIAPIDKAIRAGDLLVIHPEEATLGKMLTTGGGILLQDGAPLQRPVAVAATDKLVVVADAEEKQLLLFPLDDHGVPGQATAIGDIMTPGGIDIDSEGRIVATDRIGKKVLRYTQDGQEEVLADGAVVDTPVDVVVTASGAVVIADAGKNQLLHLATDGTVTTIANIEQPAAVTLVPGKHYVVALAQNTGFPVTVGSGGGSGALAENNKTWALADNNVPGGLAADFDGNVYWNLVTHQHPDRMHDNLQMRTFRLTPDGHMSPLLRFGVEPSKVPGDICRVRGSSEPLPTEPGIEPLPVPDGDAVGEGDAGTGSGSSSGTCSAGPEKSRAALPGLILLLALFAVLIWLRRSIRTTAAVALVMVTMLMASCSNGDAQTSDQVGADPGDVLSTDAPTPDWMTWIPETVAPKCEGKDLCPPASAPVCVAGAKASKRCMTDTDGCWVWSADMPCSDDRPCEDGVCGGKWCKPDCYLLECGGDGCGGSCGECTEPDTCCDGVCAPCVSDCTNKECGWDGKTGTCGECPTVQTCVAGKCDYRDSATCGEYYENCYALCEPWDIICEKDCEAYLSGQGKMAVLEYEACQLLNCAPCLEGEVDQECFGACVLKWCAPEYAACFNSKGTKNCAWTYECAEACAFEDLECQADCINQATPAAYAVIAEMVVCVEAACDQTLPDEERMACEDAALLVECAEVADKCFAECPPCPQSYECGPDSCTGLCGVCEDDEKCLSGQCEPK